MKLSLTLTTVSEDSSTGVGDRRSESVVLSAVKMWGSVNGVTFPRNTMWRPVLPNTIYRHMTAFSNVAYTTIIIMVWACIAQYPSQSQDLHVLKMQDRPDKNSCGSVNLWEYQVIFLPDDIYRLRCQ